MTGWSGNTTCLKSDAFSVTTVIDGRPPAMTAGREITVPYRFTKAMLAGR